MEYYKNADEKAVVSIVMITYGHEKFIEKAIDSVLSQKCNFEFELIVSNDCSPDDTDEIINNIINIHPRASSIKYIKHKHNIGAMSNFLYSLDEAKGKYIALCDGDDYWIDPLKLQTQINFLEANFDYSMCFHPVEITLANKNDNYVYPIPSSDILHLKDIIQKHYIPTCSLVFRNGFFPKGLPEWMINSISGDIPLEILLASKGKIKYFPQKMSCYRRNEGGISLSQIQIAKMHSGYIYMYSKLASEISFPNSFFLYKKVIRIQLSIIKNVIWRFIGF
jgi:glycosyltransferase involved in cell wall biosynthesis